MNMVIEIDNLDKTIELDDFEEVCLQQIRSTEKYRRRLENELKKNNNGKLVIINLNSTHEYLEANSFFEIKSEVLKEFCKNNNLKLFNKSKIISLDMNKALYKYYFVSDKKTHVAGLLIKDLREYDCMELCEKKLNGE